MQWSYDDFISANKLLEWWKIHPIKLLEIINEHKPGMNYTALRVRTFHNNHGKLLTPFRYDEKLKTFRVVIADDVNLQNLHQCFFLFIEVEQIEYDFLCKDDKDFMTEEELLKKWNIDEYGLLHWIDKEQKKYVRSHDPVTGKAIHTAYRFQPWNPATLEPILIDESLRWKDIKAEKVHDLASVPVFDRKFLPFLKDCKFLKEEVDAMERDYPELINKAVQTDSLKENEETEQQPAAYIKKCRGEGAEDAIIAVGLHDKFKLTYLQTARELGLDRDLAHILPTTLKQRGKRLYDKGKAILLQKPENVTV